MKQSINSDDKNISFPDVMIALAFIFIGIIMLLVMRKNEKSGFDINISVDGNITKTLSLDKDMVYEVVTDYGNNKIVIEDGKAYVSEADCRDKICVNYKPIDKVGDTIICLPHKLVVEVTE